jgi:5-methylcytosine-specific restriction endonuclease McrA
MSIWQQVEDEFDCDHAQTEIRCKYDSLGRPQYVKQCLTCGQPVGSFIARRDIPNIEKVSAFDTILEDIWRSQREQRYQTLVSQSQDKQGTWWDEYRAYLSSPEWKAKRTKVLARDKYVCQACLSRPATEIHHLTYDHVGNEPLFELTSVCATCHEQLTELDNQRRLNNGHARSGLELSR